MKVIFCHNNRDNPKKWVWSVIREDNNEWIVSKNTQDEAWNYCDTNGYRCVGCKQLKDIPEPQVRKDETYGFKYGFKNESAGDWPFPW